MRISVLTYNVIDFFLHIYCHFNFFIRDLLFPFGNIRFKLVYFVFEIVNLDEVIC